MGHSRVDLTLSVGENGAKSGGKERRPFQPDVQIPCTTRLRGELGDQLERSIFELL
jgi:hypothetical protein